MRYVSFTFSAQEKSLEIMRPVIHFRDNLFTSFLVFLWLNIIVTANAFPLSHQDAEARNANGQHAISGLTLPELLNDDKRKHDLVQARQEAMKAIEAVDTQTPSSTPHHPIPATSTSTRSHPRPTASGPSTDTELRILPLGDSITFGTASPDGNGYRKRLLDDLTHAGHSVMFAGVVQSGDMQDNWMAGYPAKTIDYIESQMGLSLAQKPNIICLHAGTNDMSPDPNTSKQGSDPKEAARRLGSMIDQIGSEVQNATVLVAQIIGTRRNPESMAQQANVDAFNHLIPDVVRERARTGAHIMMVDFQSIHGEVSTLGMPIFLEVINR